MQTSAAKKNQDPFLSTNAFNLQKETKSAQLSPTVADIDRIFQCLHARSSKLCNQSSGDF